MRNENLKMDLLHHSSFIIHHCALGVLGALAVPKDNEK